MNTQGTIKTNEIAETANKLNCFAFKCTTIDGKNIKSNNTKKDICPPMGNPFAILPNYTILQNLENLDDVRKILLEIMEKFVNSGINKDNKCLGAYYVLGAITLVNNEAATSLPWLYEASYHM